MLKLVLGLLMCIFLAGTSLVTMIYGWGLTPVSWGWVAFGYLALVLPTVVSVVISD